MKVFILHRPGIKHLRLILLALLFSLIGRFSNGQIVTLPLNQGDIPFLRGNNQFASQNITSKSLLWFTRSTTKNPNFKVVGGTGFLIRTDISKPYYCMLTAGHTMYDATSVDVEEKNKNVQITMFNGVTFNSAAAAFTNPTQFTTDGGSLEVPVSVTVVEAKVSNTVNSRDWIDYALVKIDKSKFSVTQQLYLHGVEFIDKIDKSRLKNDSAKTAYVVHHGLLKPQQYSFIKKENFIEPKNGDHDRPPVYTYMFGFPKMYGLYDGSSGAPLVLPKNNGLGAAIGIYAGTGEKRNIFLPPHIDQNFYKISNIKDLIKEHCSSSNEDEIKVSVEVRNGVAVSSAVGIYSRMESLLSGLRNTIRNLVVNMIRVPNPANSAESVAEKSDKCIIKINEIEKAINEGKSVGAIRRMDTELDLMLTELDRRIDRITLDYNKNQSEELTVSFFYQFRHTFQSLSYETGSINNETSTDYPWLLGVFGKMTPIAMPILRTKLRALRDNVRYILGQPTLAPREKRDSDDVKIQMQAPDELVDAHKKVAEAVQTGTQLMADVPGYDRSINWDVLTGIVNYYENEDTYSDSYLLENYFIVDIALSIYTVETLKSELAILKGKTLTDKQRSLIPGIESQISLAIAALKTLTDKNYPKGYLAPAVNPMNYLIPKKYIYNQKTGEEKFLGWGSYFDFTWTDYGLIEGNQLHEYPIKDIPGTNTVKQYEVEGKYEYYTIPSGLQEKYSWGYFYTTSLKMKIELDEFYLIYHPYFKTFTDLNKIIPEQSGTYGGTAKNATFNSVVDSASFKAYDETYQAGAGLEIYSDKKKVFPLFITQVKSKEKKLLNFSAEAPEEVLFFSRSYKEIRESFIATKFNYWVDEEYRIDNSMKNNFLAMQDAMTDCLIFTHSIRISKDITWRYQYPIEFANRGSKMAAPQTVQTKVINHPENLILYPNPVSDHLHLIVGDSKRIQALTVTNSSGMILNPPAADRNGEKVIDIQKLTPGIYFITIQVEGQAKKTLKFIKQ